MDNNLQQYKKTLTDRLLERSRESGMPNTELENLRTEGIKRFETAFDDPNTPVLPSDVFGKFGTFRKAFEPQQPTEVDLINMISALGKLEKENVSESDVLSSIFGVSQPQASPNVQNESVVPNTLNATVSEPTLKPDVALQSTLQGTRSTNLSTGESKILEQQPIETPADVTKQTSPRITDQQLFQVLLNPDLSAGTKSGVQKMYDLQQESIKEKDPTDLRKEFSQETDNLKYLDMRTSFDKINSAQNTAAGDLSLIFSYMKILDPTSVVREGEQASAQNTTGVPARILNLYNRVNTGERLNPAQREEFKSQAKQLYNAVAIKQKELVDFYASQAIKQGVDPEDVIGLIGEVKIYKDDGKEETITSKQQVKEKENALMKFFSGILPKEGDPKNFGERYAQILQKKGYIEPDEFEKTASNMNVATNALTSMALSGDLQALQSPRLSELLTKKGVVETVDKLRQSTPIAKAGQSQAASASRSTAIPDVSKIKQAGDVISRADTDIFAAHAKEAKSLENIKSISDLLDRMAVWGSRSYTKSGGVKSSAKAQLYSQYYSAGLNILKNQAPEVYQDRQLLRLVIELPKTAGKALWKATLGKVLLQ